MENTQGWVFKRPSIQCYLYSMQPYRHGRENLCTEPHLEFIDTQQRKNCYRKIAYFAIFFSNCTHLALFYLEVPCGLAPLIWLIGAIEADRVWREGVRTRKWRGGAGCDQSQPPTHRFLSELSPGKCAGDTLQGMCFLHFCLNTLHDKGSMVIMTNLAKSFPCSLKEDTPTWFDSIELTLAKTYLQG